MFSSNILCFDFGNSKNKVGILNKVGVIQDRIELPATSLLDSIDQLITHYSPESSILSSVVPYPDQVRERLSQRTKFCHFTHKSNLPFKTNAIKYIEEVGLDRLAAVAGVMQKKKAGQLVNYSHKLVIVCGTYITYNFVDIFDTFLGGAISLGMNLRLAHCTQKFDVLPGTVLPPPLLGTRTATAIESGTILGIAYEIDGFINRYKEKYDNLQVYLTGGDAITFAKLLTNKVITDNDIVFKGLYEIALLN